MNGSRSNDLLVHTQFNLNENPFAPHPWLWNGHLQTVVGSRQRREFPWGWQEYSEDVVALENGSKVRVRFDVRDPRRPTLFVVHGMSGSSDSGYMLALSHKAAREGWNFVLPSLYNVGENPGRPKIFHAGCSGQIAELVDIFADRHGLEVLFIAGISMGGNILLKLLGEWGSRYPENVRAAAAISPLVDLVRSWPVLDRPLNVLYRRHYLRRLRSLSTCRPDMIARFVDLKRLRKVKTIQEFDEVVTAPLSGFDNAIDYYRQVSALSFLSQIILPTLIIHSKDDPLLPWEPLSEPVVVENDALLVHLTEAGGHVAFIAREQKKDIDRSWAENRIIDFFRLAVV